MAVFGIDNRNGFVVIDALVKGGSVESNIGGEFFQIGFGKRADPFTTPFAKELVVIFPELALFVRTFGGVRCPVRFAHGSLIDHGKISIRKLDFACFEIIFLELALRAKRKIFAVRSLKIGILDQF